MSKTNVITATCHDCTECQRNAFYGDEEDDCAEYYCLIREQPDIRDFDVFIAEECDRFHSKESKKRWCNECENYENERYLCSSGKTNVYDGDGFFYPCEFFKEKESENECAR